MYNAGRLDQRIRIERRPTGKDAHGQAYQNWELVAERWAAAEPVRGREYFSAQQMQDVTEVKFTVRFLPGVKVTDRVVWRGMNHEIVSVIDPKAQTETMELMCMNGLRDGRD